MDANDNPVLFYCINALDRVKEIEDSREKASFSEKCMRCINLVWDKQKELVNKDQQTALMLCAGHNLMYQVKELAPSQMGRQDKAGRTALMYAANVNAIKIAEMLKEEAGKQTAN